MTTNSLSKHVATSSFSAVRLLLAALTVVCLCCGVGIAQDPSEKTVLTDGNHEDAEPNLEIAITSVKLLMDNQVLSLRSLDSLSLSDGQQLQIDFQSADSISATVSDRGVYLGVVPSLRSVTDGMLVDRVVKNSPAEKAEIQKNDVITKVNGVPINGMRQLDSILAGADIDDTLAVTVERDDTEFTKNISLNIPLLKIVKKTEDPDDGSYTMTIALNDIVDTDKIETSGVARLRICAKGPNGRQAITDLRIFVNSGGFVGVIIPRPKISGSSDQFTIDRDNLEVTVHYEGTVLYIDDNSNGNYDKGEPVTVVDSNNEFRFPNHQAFYFEHLVRPLSIIVNGNTVTADKWSTMFSPQNTWFQIEKIRGEKDTHELLTAGAGDAPGHLIEQKPAASEQATETRREHDPTTIETSAESTATNSIPAAESESEAVEKLYVDSRAKITPDGGSWNTAFETIQDALDQAALLVNDPNNPVSVHIWVADGVYVPSSSGFAVLKEVSLYGGFTGREEKLEERPSIKRGTILSGDVDGNDGHFASVASVAASPDGQLVATASEDRTIKVWNASDRKLQATLNGHLNGVCCACFAPIVVNPATDEVYRLVTGGKDMTVRLWSLYETGGILKIAPSRILPAEEDATFSHYGTVNAVSVSPNGSLVASASEDGTVIVWKVSDVTSPQLVAKLLGHECPVNSITFLDNTYIVSAGEDGTIRAWLDSGTGWHAAGLLTGHTGRVTHIAAINPSENAILASAGEDATIRIWKRMDLTERKAKLITTDKISAIPQSGSNEVILAKIGSEDIFLRIFNEHGDEVFFQPFSQEDRNAVEKLPNNLWNAGYLSGNDRFSVLSIVKLQVPLQQTLALPVGEDFGPITCLAVAPNQRYLVSSHEKEISSSLESKLCLWNCETGQCTESLTVGDIEITDIATGAQRMEDDSDISPYNYRIIAGRADNASRIWDVTTLPSNAEFTGQTTLAAIAPNGEIIASVEDKTVKVRTVVGNTPPVDLLHDDSVSALSFSRKETPPTHLATGSDVNLRWWKLDDQSVQERKTEHAISCIAVSADDEWLATAGDDKVIRVWKTADLDNSEVDPIEFGGHLEAIKTLAIVSAGEEIRIVSASLDGTIKVWNLEEKVIETTIDVGAAVGDIAVTYTNSDLTITAAQLVTSFNDVRLRAASHVDRQGVGEIVDGVEVVEGDPILLTGQNDSKENGIYVAATGQWDRARDAADVSDFQVAKHVFVKEGQAYAHRYAKYAGKSDVVPGTSDIHFVDSDGTVVAWNWKFEQEKLTQLDTIPAYFVNSIDSTSNGNTLVMAVQDSNSVTVWQRDANRPFSQYSSLPHIKPINVAVSLNGERILSSSGDTVRVWNQVPFGVESDLEAFGKVGGNAESVLTIEDGATNVKLDGFVIHGGLSNNASGGGGVQIGQNADVTIENCILEGNKALKGGAVSIATGAITCINNCTFNGNAAPTGQGGAIFSIGENLSLDSCVFHANDANDGDAVYAAADPAPDAALQILKVKQCTVSGCIADKGSVISSNINVSISNSTIAGTGNMPTIGLHNSANMTLQDSIVSADTNVKPILTDTGTVDDSSEHCLLPAKVVENPSFGNVLASPSKCLYLYTQQDVDPWDKDQDVHVGKLVRPADGPPGLVFLCIKTDATKTGQVPPDWPTDINKDVIEKVDDKEIIWRSIFDLAASRLFDDFGDIGGLYETLPLTSDSIARELGSRVVNNEWDQRGRPYVRSFSSPDVGAIEWQPMARDDQYEYYNTQTNFVDVGDPLVNDAPLRINSTLSISDNALVKENPTIHFQQVRLVSTEDLGTAPQGAKTIDGIPTKEGDRVLLVNQGNGNSSSNNGIYVVDHENQWKEADDADELHELLKYKTVFVAEGKNHAGTTWTLFHDGEDAIPAQDTPLAFDYSWTPTTFGQAKLASEHLFYKLKPELIDTNFLGRDEINYACHFGHHISRPARATVWTVGPIDVESGNVHRFMVTTAADQKIPDSGPVNFKEGGLTLREAMLLASRTTGDDLIEFDLKYVSKDESSVINLVAPLVFPADARGTLTIRGPGIDKLCIDGGAVHRGLEIRSRADSVPNFNLSGLIFRNCRTSDESQDGAAMLVRGSSAIRISQVGFVCNTAHRSGGALHSESENILIDQCTFAENQSQGTGNEVAVISPKTLAVTKSVLFNNRFVTATDLDKTSYDDANEKSNFYEDPRFVVQPAELWTPDTSVKVGQVVRATNPEVPFVFQRITAGTTASEEPTWPTVAEDTVEDNEVVVWKAIDSANKKYGNIILRRDSLAYRHDVLPWTPETQVVVNQLMRPDQLHPTLVLKCIKFGTTSTDENIPGWPTKINDTVKDNDVEWVLIEEKLRTFRFLGAYPKFPNGSEAPFGNPANPQSEILYVDSSVRNPGDGSSWKSALPTLNDAIEVASADYRITTIKIAGKHSPKRHYATNLPNGPNTPSPEWTFILQHGLTLEGGFRPASSFDLPADDDRDAALVSDPASFATLLSGQLPDDIYSVNVLTSHGVHGFRVAGVTVADGSSDTQPGGGLVVRGETSKDPIGTISGVLFRSNHASDGGAIYLDVGALDVERSMFLENGAEGNGGAIFVASDGAILRESNSTFVENSATTGGAIYAAKGNISLDHLTIIRNTAKQANGAGGLFVANAVENTIINTIVCENTSADGQPADTNLTVVDETNRIGLQWASQQSLLAKPNFNAFQTDKGILNGPTETIAILPQIPFRMGSSNGTLVQASDHRSTDQRGAIGTSLTRSDIGAFERQYFIRDKSMTRFFIVDDGSTKRQLWAEVVDRGEAKEWKRGMPVSKDDLVYAPDSDLVLIFQCTNAPETGGVTGSGPLKWPTVSGAKVNDGDDGNIEWTAMDAATTYVQVSQHLGQEPKIRMQSSGGFAVQEKSIEFEVDDQALISTRQDEGLVQPSTLFPFVDHTVKLVTINAVSKIKLELAYDRIILHGESTSPATTWSVNGEQSPNAEIVNPIIDKKYRVELRSNNTPIETIEFTVSQGNQ